MEVQLYAFLTLAVDGGERCVDVQALYPWGNSHRYPLDRRLSGPQSQSVGGGEEK